MIRFIVAIDSKQGLADEKGIPWDLPTDRRYYRDKISKGIILMGYGTYAERKTPIHKRVNYVATSSTKKLLDGFIAVNNTQEFLEKAQEDVWVIGGAGLFKTTLQQADELYITQLKGDFGCTKFFPNWQNEFELAQASEWQQENNIDFRFEIWRRKPQ